MGRHLLRPAPSLAQQWPVSVELETPRGSFREALRLREDPAYFCVRMLAMAFRMISETGRREAGE